MKYDPLENRICDVCDGVFPYDDIFYVGDYGYDYTLACAKCEAKIKRY